MHNKIEQWSRVTSWLYSNWLHRIYCMDTFMHRIAFIDKTRIGWNVIIANYVWVLAIPCMIWMRVGNLARGWLVQLSKHSPSYSLYNFTFIYVYLYLYIHIYILCSIITFYNPFYLTISLGRINKPNLLYMNHSDYLSSNVITRLICL